MGYNSNAKYAQSLLFAGIGSGYNDLDPQTHRPLMKIEISSVKNIILCVISINLITI